VWLAVYRKVAPTVVAPGALRFGVIEAAFDDVLVLLAGGAWWIIHGPILTLLCYFRHSPPDRGLDNGEYLSSTTNCR